MSGWKKGLNAEGDMVIGTRTELYNLEIDNGKIVAIQPANGAPASTLPAFDAKVASPACHPRYAYSPR